MKKMLLFLGAVLTASAMAETTAVIGAMDSEIKNLISAMKDVEIEEKAKVKFYKGELEGKDVVVFKSGIGKVNAAMATTLAIENYDVDRIIFTGVAGAVDNSLNITDIVISKDLVQHDYDTTAFGEKKGNVPGSQDTRFIADEKLIKLAKDSAVKVMGENRVHIGTIATGDQFIADKKLVEGLRKDFNASAVEMEGASVAHVANLYDIPIVVVRAMSDKADGSAHMNYGDFVNIAADNSVKIVKEMLKNLK